MRSLRSPRVYAWGEVTSEQHAEHLESIRRNEFSLALWAGCTDEEAGKRADIAVAKESE